MYRKLGKNSLIGLFSILTLIVSAILVLSTIRTTFADESTTDVVESSYLLNGDPYQSNLVVGETSGYGKFVLNQDNVTLTTTARSGFQLVGWQIVYLDRDNQTDFIDSADLTSIDETSASKEVQVDVGDVAITYTFTYIDSNGDGYYDNGTYNISNIFENLQVNPVFDFIYYSVNIDNIVDVMNVEEMQSENINSTDVVYYTSSVVEENLTHYYDAIISGDLGHIGKEIVTDILKSDGYNIKPNYNDCGVLIFDKNTQDTHSGGSGCACCGTVFSGYFFKQLKERKMKRILLIATGALMNSTSSQQGESIPGIAHAISIENL